MHKDGDFKLPDEMDMGSISVGDLGFFLCPTLVMLINSQMAFTGTLVFRPPGVREEMAGVRDPGKEDEKMYQARKGS